MDGQLSDQAKELLLAEYKYITDSLWKVNDVGEKRVTFFITIATAVVTALVTLVTNDKGGGLSAMRESTREIVVFALLGLLVVGYMTLARMIHRNRETHEYELQLQKIYRQFRNHPDLEHYQPLEPERFRQRRAFLLKYGGLTETVAAVNSLIFAAVVVLAASAWKGWVIGDTVIAGFICFGAAFWLQVRIRSYMTGEQERIISAGRLRWP